MNIKLTLASAVTGFTLCATGPAMAQFDLLDGWSGSAGLGVLFTSGNSENTNVCLLYTSPSPRDATLSRMPSSA